VQLFEILQDGFHTPLTEAQIAELFQAGRLNRHTRCKPASQAKWRTIDELFPLLKYHTSWQFGSESPETSNEFRFRSSVVVPMCLAGAAAITIVIYLLSHSQSPLDRHITAIDSISASTVPSHVRRTPVLPTQSLQNTVSSPTTASFPNASINQVVVPAEELNRQSYVRSAETARVAEQNRREQAQAQQQRQQQEEAAKQQRLLEEQKAAGRNEHVPLDQWQIVDVGGEAVRVKIHDNDVTTFDVWINGEWRRQVPKEKGITGSGTDETLIYRNGRAALYYVWEISGKINHCLLRIRDA
jgi:hypothetical protein